MFMGNTSAEVKTIIIIGELVKCVRSTIIYILKRMLDTIFIGAIQLRVFFQGPPKGGFWLLEILACGHLF